MKKTLKEHNPRHIIIDGADGLGKTTICQILGRELDLPIIKMPNSAEFIKDGQIERVSKFFNELILQFEEFNFIMDRGYPSSLVYSSVLKRNSDLSYLAGMENALNPDIFILTYDLDSDEFKGFRPDEIYDNDKLTKVDQEFKRLSTEKGYTIISVKDKTPIQICKIIIGELRKKYGNEY